MVIKYLDLPCKAQAQTMMNGYEEREMLWIDFVTQARWYSLKLTIWDQTQLSDTR
jgi:hypothetical protein